jgi:hypothetical protein
MSHFCRDSAGYHFLKLLRKGGRMDSTRKGNPNVVMTTHGHPPEHSRLERPSRVILELSLQEHLGRIGRGLILPRNVCLPIQEVYARWDSKG